MIQKLTATQSYDWGEFYSMVSTICNDFVPEAGDGSCLLGTMAKSNKLASWYLDFSSAYSIVALGYNHPAVKRALLEQIATGLWGHPSHDWHNQWSARLVKKLVEIAPVPQPAKVFLCNSGAEAIEAAIKACDARRLREKTCRPRLLSFKGSFHGRTAGAMSILNRKPVYRDGFRVSHQSVVLTFPCLNDPTSIIRFHRDLNNISRHELNQINACFLELIQGEGGIRVIDKVSLKRLVDVCRQHGIFLVIDEIQTGLMRTGKMFACEHFNVQPDIICMAKALGGGLPLGAIVANEQFDFEASQHSSTFGGVPLNCAAALAVIGELEKLDTAQFEERVHLMETLAPEGLGMMRRIVLRNNQPLATLAHSIMEKYQLIVIPAGENVLRVMPPLNISMTDLANGLDKLNEATKNLR